MAEPNPGSDFEQSVCLGRKRGIDADPLKGRGTPEQGDVPGRFGRRRQKQASRRAWERLKPSGKPLLYLARQRYGRWQPESTGEFFGREPVRQFEDSERVSP